jgi:hypothetical protein
MIPMNDSNRAEMKRNTGTSQPDTRPQTGKGGPAGTRKPCGYAKLVRGVRGPENDGVELPPGAPLSWARRLMR